MHVALAVSLEGEAILFPQPRRVGPTASPGVGAWTFTLARTGGAHAACVPLPGATLTEPMTQPWQPFPFLGFQTPGLGRLRLEQACTSEGGFLAAVTTRLFCPALS